MEADLKSVRFAQTIKYFRLLAAIVLASAFIFFWLCYSLDIVMAHLGMNPDGPALVILGAILITLAFAAPVVCLLCVGLAYSFVVRLGRLNFLMVMAAAVPGALIYALIVYAYMHPYGHPAFAWTMAVMAAVGALLAAPVFYIVGVWRNTGANHRQTRDRPSTDHPPNMALGDTQ